jgi:hypothetical protein
VIFGSMIVSTKAKNGSNLEVHRPLRKVSNSKSMSKNFSCKKLVLTKLELQLFKQARFNALELHHQECHIPLAYLEDVL